jgi:hypothetical protein
MSNERFLCEDCDPPRDVTAQVTAERDEQMAVLRARSRSGEKWSVVISCPGGHETKFEGRWL